MTKNVLYVTALQKDTYKNFYDLTPHIDRTTSLQISVGNINQFLDLTTLWLRFV